MANKIVQKAFYNLSGGINLAKTQVGLQMGAKRLYWNDSFNVETLKNLGVRTQKGNVKICALDCGTSILGLFEYPKNTDSFVLVAGDGKIYHYDALLNTLEEKYTLPYAPKNVCFSHFLDGVLICTPQNETMFFNLGASAEFSSINLKNADGEPIFPYIVGVFASRIWAVDNSTLYFSALGRYDDWESSEDAGYISNFFTSTSRILALKEYKGSLAIYKPEGVYLLSGFTPEDFKIVKFTDVSAMGNNSVVLENNKQYFFNKQGLFALEQAGELAQIVLSDNLALNISEFFEKTDFLSSSRVMALSYKNKNQIWFFPKLAPIGVWEDFCLSGGDGALNSMEAEAQGGENSDGLGAQAMAVSGGNYDAVGVQGVSAEGQNGAQGGENAGTEGQSATVSSENTDGAQTLGAESSENPNVVGQNTTETSAWVNKSANTNGANAVETGATTEVWMYDYHLKSWFKRVIPFEITTAAEINAKIYTADKFGNVYREDFSNTFSGKRIDFRFSTPFFNFNLPSRRKIIENLTFILDEECENACNFSVCKDNMTNLKTDIERIDTLNPKTLIFVETQYFEDRFLSVWDEFLWAQHSEISHKTDVFDANTSVMLNLEGTKMGDEVAISGIEFNEVLLDE